MRYDHFDMLPERAFQKIGFSGHARMTLEGGKGGSVSAPAADPNIGIAQAEMAQLARDQYTNFKDVIWPQMQEESKRITDMSTKLGDQQYALNEKNAGIADDYYNRMKDQFYPMQDKLIDEANQFNTEGERERQAQMAMGDVNDAFNNQRKQQEMQMQAFGINPTSGRYQGSVNANGVMQAAAGAAAATKARTAAEQLGWAKRMDAIGLGMGLAGNQATSTGVALNAGNSAMSNTGAGLSALNQMSGAYNSAAGTAMQGWNSVGTLGVQKYNADINSYTANQQANASNNSAMGSTLGSLAATAVKAAPLFMSDERIKENLEYMGDLESGIKVYAFEYKPEFKDHPMCGHGRFIGVMAQDVEKIIPEAVITMDNGYKAVNYELVR